MECCSHLLKRLRADSALQVPCAAVLARARAAGSGAFTKNFAQVFLEVGAPRLDAEGKSKLARALLVGIGGEKGGGGGEGPYGRQSVAMAHRLLELLEHLKPAASAAAEPETPPSGEPQPSERDLVFVQELLFDLLLVPNATYLRPKPQPAGPGQPQQQAAQAPAAPVLPLPPGLSREALDRLASHPSLWVAGAGSGHGGSSQAALAKVRASRRWIARMRDWAYRRLNRMQTIHRTSNNSSSSRPSACCTPRSSPPRPPPCPSSSWRPPTATPA